MYKLELPKHKHDFLLACGFELEHDGGIHLALMGTIKTRMLKYKEVSKDMYEETHSLYIHFSEDESAHCNLYLGERGEDVEVFSERNLISEMCKRGFKEKSGCENG